MIIKNKQILVSWWYCLCFRLYY